jgi:hypothetical protein
MANGKRSDTRTFCLSPSTPAPRIAPSPTHRGWLAALLTISSEAESWMADANSTGIYAHTHLLYPAPYIAIHYPKAELAAIQPRGPTPTQNPG